MRLSLFYSREEINVISSITTFKHSLPPSKRPNAHLMSLLKAGSMWWSIYTIYKISAIINNSDRISLFFILDQLNIGRFIT